MLKIGHRGASAYEPENTLRSFKKAIEMGVDVVELDVRITGDKELVVIHDEYVDKTTNGLGKVEELSLKEIRKLEIVGGGKIPTLEEAFEFLDRKVKIFIEIKKTRYEDRVYKLIKKKELLDNLAIISFDELVLKDIRKMDEDVETGFIYVRHRTPLEKALELDSDYILPLYRFTHTKNVVEAHDKGIKVIVWTVNNTDDVRAMREKGVDGIASDRPDILNLK